MTGKKQRSAVRPPIRLPFAMLRANRAKTRARKRHVRHEQLPAVEQPAPPRAQATEDILQQRLFFPPRLMSLSIWKGGRLENRKVAMSGGGHQDSQRVSESYARQSQMRKWRILTTNGLHAKFHSRPSRGNNGKFTQSIAYRRVAGLYR